MAPVAGSLGSSHHDMHEPSYRMLTGVIIGIAVLGFIALAMVSTVSPERKRQTLERVGVAVHKVANAAREIERKTFHVCGVLVPLGHMLLLDWGFSNDFCARLCWALTILGWMFELCRLYVPAVRAAVRASFMGGILREKEHNQFTGTAFFTLGCTLAISMFAPGVAMTSILYLVLGDMSAALIGVSFGGDVCLKRIGRQGKKSVEGSVAMFLVCFVIGLVVYNEVHLCEYAVFVAALVATLTELYEPFGLNDNLTIPVFTSVALTWGLRRVHSCSHESLDLYAELQRAPEVLRLVEETLYNQTVAAEQLVANAVHMRP